MTFQEDIDLLKRRHGRWTVGLLGCVIAGLGFMTSLLRLDAGDPLVTVLAAFAAVWLAWVAFDFAIGPLRAAQAQERRRRAAAGVPEPPAFVDTQATWRSP